MLIFALILTAIVGYFLGNINGAVIISNRVLKDDVRTKGSGNAGATNFYRNYGGSKAGLVLTIDVAKTAIACYFGLLLLRWLGYEEYSLTAKMLGGFSVIMGHMFPILLRFHGGKGVLCGASVALFMNPLMFLVLFIIFFVVYHLAHYISLCSIVAAILYPFLFWCFFPSNGYIVALAAFGAVMSIYMHRQNIQRLLNGTESKMYLKKRA